MKLTVEKTRDGVRMVADVPGKGLVEQTLTKDEVAALISVLQTATRSNSFKLVLEYG